MTKITVLYPKTAKFSFYKKILVSKSKDYKLACPAL